MFKKVLIANRGEIAVRIVQTCRLMGIGSVAVYSSPDREALHVRLADEAVALGGASSLESYLDSEAVLAACRNTGADAVHPGYGFLAENAQFARAVAEEGFTWIGPSSDAIETLGDKVRAKEIAAAAGVPVVPGYEGDDLSLERARSEAERIGYPVMLKASAGGGGKGMRAVHRPEELRSALEGARREASAAFGNDRVFLERLLVRPRHIEIQIVADTHGHAVYLGERDCSVQRRHQKVVEEAPSPAVTQDLRTEMGEAAVRLARAGSYVNAGTVEFLLHGGSFYFLEMNTRIQVEHPVTELVTGLNLVRLQIEVAAGLPLGFTQNQIAASGHAIEARIYAEDAARGFLPSTGVIRTFDPPRGAHIRNDLGVERGNEVTPYYDPMLAKLIVHRENRRAAIDELAAALDRYQIEGIETNLDFLRWLVLQPAFRDGHVDVEYLDRTWGSRPEEQLPPDVLVIAALSMLGPNEPAGELDPWRAATGWRQYGQTRTLYVDTSGVPVQVALLPRGDEWEVRARDETTMVSLVSRDGDEIHAALDGRKVDATVRLHDRRLSVEVDGETHLVTLYSPSASGVAGHGNVAVEGSLTAPMPGIVVKVEVSSGDHVSALQPLLVLEAMKMEHVIQAPYPGVVLEVIHGQGDMVPGGAVLIRLEAE